MNDIYQYVAANLAGDKNRLLPSFTGLYGTFVRIHGMVGGQCRYTVPESQALIAWC
ncbi:MAG TPA: hypothetical protein VET88_07035 [Gammaproteobacteria bacterium]|nr:hypothetical protein [Gammaproteobacteria bacterium]